MLASNEASIALIQSLVQRLFAWHPAQLAGDFFGINVPGDRLFGFVVGAKLVAEPLAEQVQVLLQCSELFFDGLQMLAEAVALGLCFLSKTLP